MICKSLNEVSKQVSRRNFLRLSALIMIGVVFCVLAGYSETQTRHADAANHPYSDSKPLDDQSAVDVINKGKQLIYEITKSV